MSSNASWLFYKFQAHCRCLCFVQFAIWSLVRLTWLRSQRLSLLWFSELLSWGLLIFLNRLKNSIYPASHLSLFSLGILDFLGHRLIFNRKTDIVLKERWSWLSKAAFILLLILKSMVILLVKKLELSVLWLYYGWLNLLVKLVQSIMLLKLLLLWILIHLYTHALWILITNLTDWNLGTLYLLGIIHHWLWLLKKLRRSSQL